MKISNSKSNGVLMIKVEGKLDSLSTPTLEGKLSEWLKDTQKIIFDFSELTYISSAGLRMILSLQKEMNRRGGMELLHVRTPVMEVFEITGFVDILTIH